MKYETFITNIRKYQTNRVHALYFPDSCSPQPISDAFLPVFPSIMNIFEENFYMFCSRDEIIGLYGLQIAFGVVSSDIPQQLNRIINVESPKRHLCCTLDYLILPPSTNEPPSSWAGGKSVIVDFTLGIIMNEQHYLFNLFGNSFSPGIVYGQIDEKKLKHSWQLITYGRDENSSSKSPLNSHTRYFSINTNNFTLSTDIRTIK